MRASIALALATPAFGLILPDEQVFSELAIEDRTEQPLQRLPTVDEATGAVQDGAKKVWHGLTDVGGRAKSYLDFVVEGLESKQQAWKESFNVDAWLEPEAYELDGPPEHGKPGHGSPHGPPHHPPHDGPHHPPHHRPHHPPHHGGPHHKSNKTVYQLISESKYTTKLAKLIDEYPEIVKALNTTANITVFAPTDKAFEKIPKHAPKPSKEFLEKVLTYHVSPFFYPAGRVLASDTIPTAYNESLLGDEPQRLSIRLSIKGLVVNFYSRIVAANIFATNGVIHGIDSILLPPPKAYTILNFLPGEFSTLLLALEKTGLGPKLNDSSNHEGGTLFAPGNFAFKKLGPGPNAFLFSEHGLKYLKALLKYHIVANQTLYSDAFYKAEEEEAAQATEEQDGSDDEIDTTTMAPRRYFHFELPTLLAGKKLPVDIARYGPFLSFKVNGFSRVVVKNGLAKDGVIQVVSDVLIPPKELAGGEVQHWDGQEMSVEEFKDRMAPLVAASEAQQQQQHHKEGGYGGGFKVEM